MDLHTSFSKCKTEPPFDMEEAEHHLVPKPCISWRIERPKEEWTLYECTIALTVERRRGRNACTDQYMDHFYKALEVIIGDECWTSDVKDK